MVLLTQKHVSSAKNNQIIFCSANTANTSHINSVCLRNNCMLDTILRKILRLMKICGE